MEKWGKDTEKVKGCQYFKLKSKELISQMTIEEKAGLCSGKDCWKLKSIKRLGLDNIMVSDGPHGLRKQLGEKDNLGVGCSVPAVCFPAASALACSFDRNLTFAVGKAIAQECLQEEIAVILGPGANQKRSPLCGRNFEYFSEDPIVSGEMAASMIQGVQSQGVGTSLKHFAVNNQEKRRMTVSAVIDERTFRETYLKAYEIAIRKGKPWTVMCAYNRINETYCSENEYLLTNILRDEWGFDGLVISDWGAVNKRVLGIQAGMDLEMPGSGGINDGKIIDAVKDKLLSEQELDKSVLRITELILKGMAGRKKNYRYDVEEHHKLAVTAAEQSAVLLKNEEYILPGNIRQKTAVIGSFAKTPRYQGAGSSKIVPVKVDNALDAFRLQGVNYTFAEGYRLGYASDRKQKEEDQLIAEACEAAKDKDMVYIFAGLPEGYESEGFDRADLSIPESHNKLISAVAACNPNVVVVLLGGAPMELPWLNKVKGILMMYLGGEGCAAAAVNLLLGNAIPCGKLAETWPIKISDTPAYHYFPGGNKTVEYRESIYVGYKYYETAKKEVLFPFGYGLSYTTFAYSDLQLDRESCSYGDKITVSFLLSNTGNMAASEIVFFFVSHKNDKVFLPEKELREFTKVMLEPGETRRVSMDLDTKNFGYYNTMVHDWYAETGDYTILVGACAKQCRLQKVLHLISPDLPQPDRTKVLPAYYHLSSEELEIPDNEFGILYGKELPFRNVIARRPYNDCNTLEDIKHTLIGKILIALAGKMAKETTKTSREEEGMMLATMKEMPFHSMIYTSDGVMPEIVMNGIIDMLNGHYGKGIRKIVLRK